MHEVEIFIKANLFKIGDPSSEENGRDEVAIFIKVDLFKIGAHTVTNLKITIYLGRSV